MDTSFFLFLIGRCCTIERVTYTSRFPVWSQEKLNLFAARFNSPLFLRPKKTHPVVLEAGCPWSCLGRFTSTCGMPYMGGTDARIWMDMGCKGWSKTCDTVCVSIKIYVYVIVFCDRSYTSHCALHFAAAYYISSCCVMLHCIAFHSYRYNIIINFDIRIWGEISWWPMPQLGLDTMCIHIDTYIYIDIYIYSLHK